MHRLRLSKREKISDLVAVFHFEDPSGAALAPYAAGAHVDFDLGVLGTRSYSLVDFSPPLSPPRTYTIAVQREEDGAGGSKAMHQLAIGDMLPVSAPKNDFSLHETEAPSILIAGGIGVTPIISFATQLRQRGADFAFHYATRAPQRCAFGEELKASFGDVLRLSFDSVGPPLDLDRIITADASDAHLYCCGPKGMIDVVRSKAEATGFPPEHIHFELFTTPTGDAGDTAFEVEIADGRVFTIPPGQSIINVLEAADVEVIYDCQRGDCGICQCDVLEGEPDHRDVVLSPLERASGEMMQICVSRAKSARLKLDI